MSEASWVFGLHAVRTLLQRHADKVGQLLVVRGREDARINEVLKLAREHELKVEFRSSQDLDQLAAGERHQGVVAKLQKIENLGEGALDEILDKAGDAPFVLVLDGVSVLEGVKVLDGVRVLEGVEVCEGVNVFVGVLVGPGVNVGTEPLK